MLFLKKGKMNNCFRTSRSAFTLIELVISITIWAIIIVGVSFFISRVNSDIVTSKNRTKIHTEMTTFIEKMNSIRTSYSSWAILVDPPSGFDVLFFTNTGSTSGVVVGVVDAENVDTTGAYKLDPIANSWIYGNKVLAIQELTTAQVQSILSSTGGIYNTPFRSDRIFPSLNMESFVATSYNSGQLIELDASVYEQFLPLLKWKTKSSLDEDTLLFNLAF